MAKRKFYVVWQGHKKGIYKSWDACKVQIKNFPGAQYKSFASKEEAELAFKGAYKDVVGKTTSKPKLSAAELKLIGKPVFPALAVDAACSGNPGKVEYRGVDAKSKKQLFIQGPFEEGTNNIGEFLALVHGLSYMKQKKLNYPIYSDSKIAMAWVKAGQCRSNLPLTARNKPLFELVKRAELWLKKNTYTTTVLKWQTKAWGEIPADFGRK